MSEKNSTFFFFVNKSGEAFPLEWRRIASLEGHSFNSAIVVPWFLPCSMGHLSGTLKKEGFFLKGDYLLTTIVFRGGIGCSLAMRNYWFKEISFFFGRGGYYCSNYIISSWG